MTLAWFIHARRNRGHGMQTESATSVIIGEGAIAVNCGSALLRAGHTIPLVCTRDESLAAWAREHSIPVTTELAELEAAITRDPVDYLFSIVNFRILPPSLLAVPKRLAINYHDGPLPQYAGTHVTSWAILNGESSHAITWHVIAERVDQGDILKQVPIALLPDESSGTLLSKCHFAAVRSFRTLLAELAAGTATRTPQEMSRRAFYPRKRPLAPGGVIPADWPAQRIAAFLRAMDFGSAPSPFGAPMVRLDGELCRVAAVEIEQASSGAAPGTVLERGPDTARIATTSEDVTFRGVQPVAPAQDR